MKDFLQPVEQLKKTHFFVLYFALLALFACSPNDNREVKIPPLPGDMEAIQEASLVALTDAIEDEPRRSDYYYRRAQLYQQVGRDDLALQDLTKAIDYRDINERYGQYYELRAQLYLQRGRIDSAFRDAEQAIKLEEGQSPGFVALLGQLYATRGDYKKANASLNDALRRTPTDPQLYYWKGHVAASTGDTSLAINYWNEALSRRPTYKEAYNRLTELYTRMKHYPQAKAYGLRGYRVDSSYVPIHLNLGKLYQLTKQNDSAKVFLHKALKNNPKLLGTMHELAGLHFNSEEYWAATPYYEKLLEHSNRWSEVPYRLYLCYDKTGRGRQAMNQYAKVIQEDSTNVAAAEVYDLLKKREEKKREWRALDSLQRRRKELFNIETIPLEIKP